MKTPYRILALTTLALTIGFGSAKAATIISDPFNAAPPGAFSSLALAGTTPITNLPGGSWVVRGTNAAILRPADFFLPGPMLFGGGGPNAYLYIDFDKATISLAGSNSGQISMSAYISPVGAGGPATLGFSNVSASAGNAGSFQFYGINLYNNGGLQTSYNGVLSSTIAYSGGVFNPALAYLLSFTVDINTGGLTALSLAGSTADYSTLLGGSSFTSTNTANVAISNGFSANMVGLTVVSVPEPSTWALLLGGGLAVAYLRRARRS